MATKKDPKATFMRLAFYLNWEQTQHNTEKDEKKKRYVYALRNQVAERIAQWRREHPNQDGRFERFMMKQELMLKIEGKYYKEHDPVRKAEILSKEWWPLRADLDATMDLFFNMYPQEKPNILKYYDYQHEAKIFEQCYPKTV